MGGAKRAIIAQWRRDTKKAKNHYATVDHSYTLPLN